MARINACIEALGEATAQGTGGMRTKIEAGEAATASGIAVVIAPGAERDVLLRLAAGRRSGRASGPPSAGGRPASGGSSALAGRAALHVDAGARTPCAIADGASSRGVRQVSGRFQPAIPSGSSTCKGSASPADWSATTRTRCAHHGPALQGIADVLGHTFGDEVIHRNNLVLLSAAEDEAGIR